MPSFPGYNPPEPGAPLPPGWLSALWAAVVKRTAVRAGPGVRVVQTQDGHVISLDASAPRRIDAVIEDAPVFGPVDANACRYTVRAIGMELTLEDVIPKLGRPTVNGEAKIWPAKVGDPCQIVRKRDAQGAAEDVLFVQTEAVAFKPCP
jgi:hypothetical protein